MNLTDTLRKLAAQPHGFRTDHPDLKAFGMSRAAVGRVLGHLVARGEIVSVRLSAKAAVYYGSKEAAEAHVGRQRDGGQVELRTPREHKPKGEAILPAAVKVTVCPPFVPRYQPVVIAGAPRAFYGALGVDGHA